MATLPNIQIYTHFVMLLNYPCTSDYGLFISPSFRHTYPMSQNLVSFFLLDLSNWCTYLSLSSNLVSFIQKIFVVSGRTFHFVRSYLCINAQSRLQWTDSLQFSAILQNFPKPFLWIGSLLVILYFVGECPHGRLHPSCHGCPICNTCCNLNPNL